MKKTIKLAVVAALALGATSAFATNGSTMIGMGAKANGMAGTGIGMSHGAESALTNPALITTVENTEVSFGGTFFMPSVSNDMGAGAEDSAADLSVIPTVALATKVTDNFYMGVGMWGTAGMGVDYREYAANMNMVTNLQLMQFGVPLAYKTAGVSLAVTPIIQYGALDINYANSTTQGVAQDLQLGYNLGASYEVSGFTVGAVYKSEIEMTYDGQISQAMSDFTGAPASMFSDKLSTPAEMGIGISYTTKGHTVALDYKNIVWSEAKGYEDFKWEDQNVYSIGYEYAASNWAARVGYNYAESPIKEQTGANGGLINTLNLLGFPAIIESHIAVGGTYNVSEQTSFDLAYVYSPEAEESFAGMMPNSTVTTKHSQSAFSAQVNFAF
jgi:long-chain fatty acid transport protein